MTQSPASPPIVRRATEQDISAIAAVNSELFLGDRKEPKSAEEWIGCRFRSFPLYQIFVAAAGDAIAGYVGWEIHGGFLRPEPSIELEQIAVSRDFQSQGIGDLLVSHSMKEVVEWVKKRNDRIESYITFFVWAYAHNYKAMELYAKVFTDGVRGMRIQYGERAENMLRLRIPMVHSVRDHE